VVEVSREARIVLSVVLVVLLRGCTWQRVVLSSGRCAMADTEDGPRAAASPEGRVLRVFGALIVGMDLALAWSEQRAGHAVAWSAWAKPLWLVGLLVLAEPRLAQRWPHRQRVGVVALGAVGVLLVVLHLATRG
jgi:hypothetical protein